MKLSMRFLAIILGMAALSTVAGEPSARALKKCPFGHRTLVNVPIMYGLVVAEGPKDAMAMERDIANHKYALGGCVVMSDSPKQEVACTTCGFTYSIFSTKDAKDGSWILTVSDRKKLFKPLTGFWDDYPVLLDGKGAGSLSITQSFDRQMKLEWESVRAEQKRTYSKVTQMLSPWLKRHEMALDQTAYRNQRQSTWRRDNPLVEVSLAKGEHGRISVDATCHGP